MALSPEQQLAELAKRLRETEAERDALKAKAAAQSVVRFKVSEKGAISVYGLGRWPLTLYRSQMERLIAEAPAITKFMADNASKLATKTATV